MKKITSLLLLLIAMQVSAQKVGIGTNTPTETLDVNGKLNVQGNIKISGVAGTDGQVLMTNNTGATVWGDICDFKNIASFTQNTNWIIPPGVTKIVIEAWGGGGGGAAGGGGAGGGYIRSQVTSVSPGNITITIGTGGAGAATEVVNASDGTQTTISGVFGAYTAPAGGGGGVTGGGIAFSFGLAGDPYILYPGEAGYNNAINFAQRTAGQFVEIKKYGAGGGSFPFYNAGGDGGTIVKDLNTLLFINVIAPSNFIKTPGAGGGGGFNPNGATWGAAGSNGMVIIHY